MNLDTRARLAVDEVLTTPRDLESGLADLQRTRRRRATGRAVAASVVMILALAGVLLARNTDHRPEPAPPVRHVHNGAVLSVSSDTYRAEQVAGRPLATSPSDWTPDSNAFRFSSDGTKVIYSYLHQVFSAD